MTLKSYTQGSEILPEGTLIIPMDNALQGNFNERAYGLAVHLLHAEIPLKWIIEPTKSKDGIDFTASARLRYPSTGTYATRNFKAGPLAIYPGFEAEAQGVINSFNAGGADVNVYELENATSAYIHATLTHKPKVGVFNDGGKASIHTTILNNAGLVSGTHYEISTADDLTDESCFTLATEPHSDFDDDTKVTNVRNFVLNGGNFFAQCAAVRSYQANTVKLFQASGFVDEPGVNTFAYDNHFEPMAQFEGTLDDEGGSLEDFGFTTDPAGGTRIVYDATAGQGDEYKSYVGRIDGVITAQGGYIHYLGGHDYKDSGMGQINGRRHLLNAVLRSAERPAECGLNLGPVAQDDNGEIDCGTPVTIDVLANDSSPLGNPLNVNLLGTGTYGDFVDNEDGTVTYTPDPGAWLGPDQVDYEACDGSDCSQATITVTGGSNLELSGTVFEDQDLDGTLDAGETGPGGVQVNLYVDENGDGQVDGGDSFVSSQNTSGDGSFQFFVTTPPTSSVNTYISTTKATGNFEGNDDEGYGACAEIFVQEDSGDRGHVFIEFNLSSLPVGCTVSSANLRLVLATGHSGDNFNVQVRRVTNSWVEGNGDCDDSGSNTSGVTWLNRATGTPWSTQGGDFASMVYATFNAGDDDPNGTVYNIDVTSLVNAWLTGTPNYGLVLIPATVDQSGGSDWFYLYSDDAIAANRPQLEVTQECVNASDYVMNVTLGTLPTGAMLTTDNVEVATFTELGQMNCDNNFGYDPDFQPVANDDSATTEEDNPVSISVLVNDDFGGDGPGTGPITVLTQPAHGSAVVNDGGTPSDPTDDLVDYTPDPNYYGTDQFTYEICDADGDCDPATVTIVISSVNDFPVAYDDMATTDEDTPLNIAVLINDDFGGDGPGTGPISVLTQPAHGTAMVNDGGTPSDPTDDTIDYTPGPNYDGPDQFTYEICDADGDCDPATVTITINNVTSPDVTIVITSIPNIMQGLTEFNVFVEVTELNLEPTEGQIVVRIPKDTRWGFLNPYNPALTGLDGVPLNNANWTFTDQGTFFEFISDTEIPAGDFSTIGFEALWDAGFTAGVYTITSQIVEGSGGEDRIDNNVDAEKIDYFVD